MSPLYCIACLKCSHKLEYHFFTLNWEKEIRMYNIKCPGCGAKEWIKLPSAPALKKSGTYSFLEGLKK